MQKALKHLKPEHLFSYKGSQPLTSKGTSWMENECDEMAESDIRRWVMRNFCELKEHVLTNAKKLRTLKKRFDEMLMRINNLERNMNELMELKNTT